MKSLSEMIEIRRMTKPVDVRPIPFCDIGVIESEDKNLWELATRDGIMTFSVDYNSFTAVCQVARDNTIHTVVRVDVVWNFEAVDAADRIHADMMNVIRNIAKIHGCNAEIYDEHDLGKTYRMFDDFDKEEKRLYINFTRKPEEKRSKNSMNNQEYLEKLKIFLEKNKSILSQKDEWHARRVIGVGGSEIATAMGLNPWHSAHELWLEKTGKMPAFEGNNATTMGHILEPAVAAWYQKETGSIVEEDTKHYQSQNAPWLVGNIDRRIVGGGVLECKTSDTQDPYGAGWGDGNQYHPITRELIVEDHKIPRYYELQVRLYMIITGEPFADVAVIFKSLKVGEPFRIFRIYPDENDTQAIIKAGHDFMTMVFDDIEPPMTAEEIAKNFANRQSVAASVEIDAGQFARLEEVKAQIKELEAEEKELSDAIKSTLKDAETGAVYGSTAVTWKSQKKKVLDTERLKAEKPEIFAQYQKESIVRILRLKNVFCAKKGVLSND